MKPLSGITAALLALIFSERSQSKRRAARASAARPVVTAVSDYGVGPTFPGLR